MSNQIMVKSLTAFFSAMVFIVIAAILSSAITLVAINNLFGTTLAIDVTNVLSLAWLQIIVTGLIKQAKPNA
jgi:hypothetical protein